MLVSLVTGLLQRLSGKESTCNEKLRREFLSVGQGRFPGGGNGRLAPVPLLKNAMESGAWWSIVNGVTKSWT